MCGNITKAAEAAGVERRIHYRWLANERYARDFAAAERMFGDVLEAEAIRRANEGVLEPVYYQGAACGVIRKFSDGLMWHLLERFKPGKYGSKPIQVTGPGGGAVVVTAANRDAGLASLTHAELESLIALTRKVELGAARGRADIPPPPQDR